MSHKDLRKMWVSRVSDFRASKEPVTQWCERHQIKRRQLYFWMRQLREADQQTSSAGGPKWVSLSPKTASAEEIAPIRIMVGGATVEVRTGSDPTALAPGGAG